MPTRFSVVLDDERAREVEALARENDLTEEAVLRQLLDLGMDTLEVERGTGGAQPAESDDPSV
jgi:predicted transcriptional regulator